MGMMFRMSQSGIRVQLRQGIEMRDCRQAQEIIPLFQLGPAISSEYPPTTTYFRDIYGTLSEIYLILSHHVHSQFLRCNQNLPNTYMSSCKPLFCEAALEGDQSVVPRLLAAISVERCVDYDTQLCAPSQH
jgi:hypothetical protein